MLTAWKIPFVTGWRRSLVTLHLCAEVFSCSSVTMCVLWLSACQCDFLFWRKIQGVAMSFYSLEFSQFSWEKGGIKCQGERACVQQQPLPPLLPQACGSSRPAPILCALKSCSWERAGRCLGEAPCLGSGAAVELRPCQEGTAAVTVAMAMTGHPPSCSWTPDLMSWLPLRPASTPGLAQLSLASRLTLVAIISPDLLSLRPGRPLLALVPSPQPWGIPAPCCSPAL